MLVAERRSRIIETLKQQGSVLVTELSRELDVSEVTIRRDLLSLEKEGFLRRTHGGAVTGNKTRYELSFDQKMNKHLEEKNRIADAAAALVQEGDSLILDSGTTTFQVAKRLKDKEDLTVVTNAVALATELGGIEGIHLIILGGEYKATTGATVGSLAIRELKQFHADKLFLGCNALTIEGGLMTPDIVDAETRQAMIESALEVIVVTDCSKIGRSSFVTIAPLKEIDKLITDKAIDPEMKSKIEDAGVEVIVV